MGFLGSGMRMEPDKVTDLTSVFSLPYMQHPSLKLS